MPTIISDIDGTILKYGDIPMPKTIAFINKHSVDHKIIILTARPEAARTKTVAALRKAGVKYDTLYMSDLPPNHENGLVFKKRKAQEILKTNNVVLSIDNDPEVRAIMKGLGIKSVDPKNLSDSSIDKVIMR